MERQNINAQAKCVFEISWEICNKVGGIYSVISSKAKLMKSIYSSYICIGPYFYDKAREDFSEEHWPDEYRASFEELQSEGVKVHYGTWQVKGEPKAILLEFSGITSKKNELKKNFWEKFEVDSLKAGWDFEEPMLFSYAAAQLLMKLEWNAVIPKSETVVHVHEWLTGFSILELKRNNSKLATVFTTHATVLGRSFSANQQQFYDAMNQLDCFNKAKELGVLEKFTAEKAAALNADVFTTVSEITSIEAEQILGRKPEVLVLNGLDMSIFPSMEDASIKHATSKDLLRELLAYTFFPHYKFNLDKNLMFFLAGRFEFENKGMDIFIEALGRLNNYLKSVNSERTITAFFFMAMNNQGVKMELLESKNLYRHISSYVNKESPEILRKIVNDFISQGEISESLFGEEFVKEMKKDAVRFKKVGTPVLCTHRLFEQEWNNRIIQAFKEQGLNNSEEEKVKVLLMPAYLNGNDALINLDFYDVIAGCHLGVFPSYYEPWGYTPLESGALGVPAVTTDLAGFGQFIKPASDSLEEGMKGIFTLERKDKDKKDVVEQLFNVMKNYSDLKHRERVENKLRAKDLAALADWNILIKNYIEAHNLALN